MTATLNEHIDMCNRISMDSEILKAHAKSQKEVISTNTALAIDWRSQATATAMGVETPDSPYSSSTIPEVAALGEYSGNDIANVIGTIDEFNNFYGNAPVQQGDHGGNVLAVTTAVSKRVLLRDTDG